MSDVRQSYEKIISAVEAGGYYAHLRQYLEIAYIVCNAKKDDQQRLTGNQFLVDLRKDVSLIYNWGPSHVYRIAPDKDIAKLCLELLDGELRIYDLPPEILQKYGLQKVTTKEEGEQLFPFLFAKKK